MTITWIGTHPQNYTPGRGKPIAYITFHHQGAGPSVEAIKIKGLTPGGDGYHYVVDASGLYQQLSEEDTAYANGNWESNQESIAICFTGNWLTYSNANSMEYGAQLVADIMKRRPGITYKRHRDVNPSTICPGNLPVEDIWNRALQINQGGMMMADENFINNVYAGALMRAEYPYDSATKTWRDEGAKGFLGKPCDVVLQAVMDSDERREVEEKYNESGGEFVEYQEPKLYVKE